MSNVKKDTLVLKRWASPAGAKADSPMVESIVEKEGNEILLKIPKQISELIYIHHYGCIEITMSVECARAICDVLYLAEEYIGRRIE